MNRDEVLLEVIECSLKMNDLLINYVQDRPSRTSLTETVHKMREIVKRAQSAE